MSRGTPQAVDEAAADLGLGARLAGVGELDPDAERGVVVGAPAAAGRLGHALRRGGGALGDGRRGRGATPNMRRPPSLASRAGSCRELGQEPSLVVEAAQVQDQRTVLDVTQHRYRQAAQRRDQRLEPAAPALAIRGRDGDAGARQRLQRQRAGADLAGAVGDVHPVGLADRRRDGWRSRDAASAISAFGRAK